mgnify:CR=1 FL=1
MAKKTPKNKDVPVSKAKNAYELLTEVEKLILDEPLRYDQTSYIARVDGFGGALGIDVESTPECGTVGCVAGWVATLKRGTAFTYEQCPGIAAEILGIDGSQVHELFGMQKAAGRAQTPEHARSGATLIRAFKKAYARQLKAKAV